MSDIKDILAELVAFPTVTKNLIANHQALDYIATHLTQRGMHVARFAWEGYGSLVATTRPTKTPRVMLAAHVDVVPASPRLFKLTEKQGKLYGRGVCDMKFAIAAYLDLVDELKDHLSSYDMGIMITTDEELGGRHGVKQLLEAGYKPKACVLPDGGDNWALEQAAKGLLSVAVTAIGTAAHGSRPWEGQNAIEKMLLFLQAIQGELFIEQNSDTSTCNIGTIRGGTVVNQVPDICTADIDIRPINREQQQHILQRMQELSSAYDVTYELRLNDSPIGIDLADPYVIAYANSIEKVTRQPLRTLKSNGGSDARYFAAYDIPTLAAYPTGGGRHSDGEWIELKGVYQFREVVLDYLDHVAKTSTRTSSKEQALKSLTSAQ